MEPKVKDVKCKRCEDSGRVFSARVAILHRSEESPLRKLEELGFDLDGQIDARPDLIDADSIYYRQRGPSRPCPDCGGEGGSMNCALAYFHPPAVHLAIDGEVAILTLVHEGGSTEVITMTISAWDRVVLAPGELLGQRAKLGQPGPT